ncbi:hypothetical protein [Altibacter lentus]|uniref:hypothetical protein n=1 Tax=Altibacter lentus TaxID=1223410 RepID=UPI0005548ADC|nr:hypothetical protein [Altibacter lentus]
MKNLFTLLVLLIALQSFAQDGLDESKSLGLVAYLNTIKEISENKILWSEARFKQRNENLENPRQEDLYTKRIIKEKYALLKWKIDLFVNQFSADLIDRNSIGLYREMNKHLVEQSKSKRIRKYIPLLDEIDETYKDLFYENYTTGLNFIETATAILTLAGFNPYTLYKDIKATKEKKIATLIGYLKEMRLKPLSELKKPEKKEKEKKEDTKSE